MDDKQTHECLNQGDDIQPSVSDLLGALDHQVWEVIHSLHIHQGDENTLVGAQIVGVEILAVIL